MKYKKQVLICADQGSIHNDLFRLPEQNLRRMKLPQNWVLCCPSSLPWGIFLFKYFFIIFKFVFFFHFSLPSLAWSGEHPVLRGRGLLGRRLCIWLFHQVGSSFWRQKELTGSWGGPRNAPFSLVPSCSTFCFVLHCGAGLFLLQSPPPLSFPAGRKGIWLNFKYNKPKSFLNFYHMMLLEMSQKKTRNNDSEGGDSSECILSFLQSILIIVMYWPRPKCLKVTRYWPYSCLDSFVFSSISLGMFVWLILHLSLKKKASQHAILCWELVLPRKPLRQEIH